MLYASLIMRSLASCLAKRCIVCSSAEATGVVVAHVIPSSQSTVCLFEISFARLIDVIEVSFFSMRHKYHVPMSLLQGAASLDDWHAEFSFSPYVQARLTLL